MRVGFDGLTITARPAGVGGAARSLLRAMASLADAPEIVAVLPEGSAADEDVAGRSNVSVVRAPVAGPDTPRALLFQHLRMPRLLEGRIDAHVAPAFVLPLLRDVGPTVLTVHDFSWRRFPDTKSARFRVYMDRVVPAGARRASAVVASSEAVRHEVLAEVPGLDPARVHAIPLAAQALPPPEDVDAVLARYAIRRPYLLAVSNFDRRKNLPALVRAWRRLRAEASPAPALVLVGDPERAAALRRSVGAREDEPLVTPGYVPRADLSALYAGAGALVVPSLYEGFGLPVLEGFAAGAPVACSDEPTLREVAGGAAVLFDPADEEDMARAIRLAAAAGAPRERLVAAGRARAREFTWERTAAAYLALLREAAAATPPRGPE